MCYSPSTMSSVPPHPAPPRWRPRWDLDDRCRRFPFLAALRERVLVFDGGMGTMLHVSDVTLDDYRGKENCIELLCETRPDVVSKIHAAYFEVGADAVETNTFGATPLVLSEFGIAERAYDLSKQAAAIARSVAADFSSRGRPRFVAGSVGPTTKSVALGHIAWEQQFESFAVQIHGLLDGGIDVLQIETQFDLINLKCAVLAAREAFKRAGREAPIIAQVTIETTGTMLVGTEISAALPVLEALDVDVVGMNCATGPDLMQEHVRYLGRTASRFVSCLPNAGLPRNVGARGHLRPHARGAGPLPGDLRARVRRRPRGRLLRHQPGAHQAAGRARGRAAAAPRVPRRRVGTWPRSIRRCRWRRTRRR